MPVYKAFLLLSGSAVNNDAISKIKIANSQGLIASMPAPQTTARRVTLNDWIDGSQTSCWAKTKLAVNRKQRTADTEIKNKKSFFVFANILVNKENMYFHI